MKKVPLPTLLFALLAFSGSCPSAEIKLRAVGLWAGFPETPVFIHHAKSENPGVEIKVKSFLNHEFEAVDVEGGSVVFTSEAATSSLQDEGKVIARSDVPAGLRSAVLLFRPGAKGEKGTVTIVDDSARSFPAGTTKVVNLTSRKIRIELEGENFDCDAEGELLIKDPPVKNNNSSGMRAFQQKDEEWVQVKSGVWPHPGTKRVIHFISMNPLTKQVEFNGVRDISSPSE